MKNLKMNRKRERKIDILERGFKPQTFSIFPAHDLVRVTRSNQNKLLEEIGL